MKFELGKYYQHTTGAKLYICGLSETYYHGRCFIGENEHGELSPIGSSEENAMNYHEINKEDFVSNVLITNNLINCYYCAFRSYDSTICNKYKVRIYQNFNNPEYDRETHYYPCVQCGGMYFQSLV